jgi:hypothetical protein
MNIKANSVCKTAWKMRVSLLHSISSEDRSKTLHTLTEIEPNIVRSTFCNSEK